MNLNFFILIIFCFISACSTDEGKTPAQLLQSGVWKLKSIKLKGVETTRPCNLDDTYTFGSSNLIIADGKTLCVPSAASTVPYTFNSNGKNLTISGKVFEVNTLVINSLVITDTNKLNPLVQVFTR